MLENSWWSRLKIATLIGWLLIALVGGTPSGPAAAVGWLLGALIVWYFGAELAGYALNALGSEPAES